MARRRRPFLADLLHKHLFAGLPDHYPLRYKLVLWKANSPTGRSWDIFQTLLSLLACAFYVVETYTGSTAWDWLEICEVVFSAFFLVDFVFNLYVADRRVRFLLSLSAWVDIATILPVYFRVLLGFSTALGFLRFVRVLRIMRILRAFKVLNNSISPVRRQILTLTLTLLSLIFLAAGVVQLVENDVAQFSLSCKYSNAATGWEPSCTATAPAEEPCDCAENNCKSWPARDDAESEPSSIRCEQIDFFSAFYFIIVTVSTVGYGDISPTHTATKAAVICFVSLSFVLIPMQVNKLTALFSMQSRYRRPFAPDPNEEHVLVVGHVTDRGVLRNFFQEFFHPDRFETHKIERHAVILAPVEPDEDISSLLLAPFMAGRVTYRIGSVLSREDLDNVAAHSMTACFVLCDRQTKAPGQEDMATILRALSLENYSPECDTFVQIIDPASKSALIEADVDVLLCVDEMKLALLARSCICPGLSTLLDNLFHTFSNDKHGPAAAAPGFGFGGLGGSSSEGDEAHQQQPPWRREYMAGCALELYHVELPHALLAVFDCNFALLADGLFAQFNVLLIGIDRTQQGGGIVLNPPPGMALGPGDVGVLIARDGLDAQQITSISGDAGRLDQLAQMVSESQSVVALRRSVMSHFHRSPPGSSSSGSSSGSVAERRGVQMSPLVTQSEAETEPEQKPEPEPEPNPNAEVMLHQPALPAATTGAPQTTNGPSPQRRRSLSIVRSASGAGGDDAIEIHLAPEEDAHDVQHLTGHIVVCGSRDNLPLFVRSLRTPELEGTPEYRPVVILYPAPLHGYKDWPALRELRDVHYVEGSPTKPADLERANVEQASCLCLLAERDSLCEIEGQSVNANVIVTFLAVEQLLPRDLFTLTELTCSSNMGVLNAKMLRRSHWLGAAPPLGGSAAGSSERFAGFFTGQRSQDRIKSASSMDLLQTELRRANNIVGARPRNAAQAFGRADGHQLMSFFASGRGYVADLFDTVLCQAYYAMQATTLCEQLILGSPPEDPDNPDSYSSGHVMQTPLPAGFAGQVFRQLFRHLLFEHRLLPLALYRAPTTSNGAPMPFVYTGPTAGSVLNAADRVFVLGDPRHLRDSFQTFKECTLCSG